MGAFSAADTQAFLLTLRLAATVTLLLLAIGMPIAWWLAHSRSWPSRVAGAVVALPLVLPPTVLGFYLLLLLGPNGWIGKMMASMHLDTLPFTFKGLVVASMLYSLPFVVQPLQGTFEAIGRRSLEVASTLGAGPLDRFLSVIVPMSWPGIVAAAVLGFAHTIGEFGVVMMIGGNRPGETRVMSIAIYDHFEAGEFAQANTLALSLVVVSFAALLAMYLLRRKAKA
ncbi:molybdate ABC transporter permease subunit [Solilutibacter silvestris]|uniref:Molybdenum transport system permease n=1 Tax=Solilutibacter silvestris TaxID=1645665 RepID=A0A2K1Q357_9GAMM|nr:molybdate ABC transporter permease subunit [Lysobacter silvestris]PNS09486.1 molybdate ABC transporter, permease protein [Lysobacter silvestris]